MFKPINKKASIAFVHDIFMAGLGFNISLYLRLGDDYSLTTPLALTGTVISVLVGAAVFYVMGLYRGVWRYASMRDLVAITKSASLAILIISLLLFFITRLEEFPRSVPLIYWFVMMALLGGPRFLYRLNKDRRIDLPQIVSDAQPIPCFLIGAGDGAELFLRALQRNPASPYIVKGMIAEKKNRLGLDIHGVQVVGVVDDLKSIIDAMKTQDEKPHRLILTKDDWPGEKVRQLFDVSEELGIPLSRLPKMTDLQSTNGGEINVRPIEVEDLLGRPQKALDKELPQSLIKGRKILVTGAGGSIGSELVRQIVGYEPAQIVLLELSEYALYGIDMEMQTTANSVPRQAVICDIRNAATLEQVFAAHKPDVVFHAAALKHVPLVEENPAEGIYTNVFGTKNVADACLAHDVSAMVQISTDKAVNPTNVMGASKRIAESYTQALDLAPTDGTKCRFITVRFGNVLGSTGSVVPLFQKQLNAGGPLTVTHADMTRYFMTVREAVELVLQASVLAEKDADLEGKICVLDMGSPVKILNLAERMIRLAGFEPYRDIDIKITGLRPGEKLFEEIFHGDEPPTPSAVDGILIATPRPRDLAKLNAELQALKTASDSRDAAKIIDQIKVSVSEFDHQKN